MRSSNRAAAGEAAVYRQAIQGGVTAPWPAAVTRAPARPATSASNGPSAAMDIFERLRARWVAELGKERVAALEDDLEALAGASGPARLGDLPGWLR